MINTDSLFFFREIYMYFYGPNGYFIFERNYSMGDKIKKFLGGCGLVIGAVAGQIYCGVIGYKTGIKYAKRRAEMTLQRYIDIKPEIATAIDEANELMDKKEVEFV